MNAYIILQREVINKFFQKDNFDVHNTYKHSSIAKRYQQTEKAAAQNNKPQFLGFFDTSKVAIEVVHLTYGVSLK